MLVSYDNSDDDDGSNSGDGFDLSANCSGTMAVVNSAPIVNETMVKGQKTDLIDVKQCRELSFNPKFEQLYAPELGPTNPNTEQLNMVKNFLTGSLEPAFMSETMFETQRKNFHALGVANDPSDGATASDMINKVCFVFDYL